MTYDDLAAMLEPVGLPINMPGQQTKALPCIAINPAGLGTENGFAFLWDECDIRVVVAASSNDPAMFSTCRDLTVRTWRQLWGTQVQVDDDGLVFGELDADPPQIYFQLSVRFPGDELCDIPDGPPFYLTDRLWNNLTDSVGDLLTQ